MRIDQIASYAEYQKDEQFQNLKIFWESLCFYKFVNFEIWLLTNF